MIEFRVLGSFEVVDRDGPLALGGPKQRAVLAVLLLHRGEAVSSDRLIDEVWCEHPPASANKLVQGYVSNLRKALDDGRLVTEGRGYALRVEPDETDVDRFEALVAKGRGALERGDALTAAAVLRDALGVWRGPALSDFAYEPFAQAEITRLEEARLAAFEDRVDADLASGEHTRLVGELEALVREHPLRERLRGQLMLALYRSGRQADALETYRVARARLVDELGLEPGPELRELERGILAQDPRLQAPPRPSGLARRAQRGGALIMLGAVALLAASVLVAVNLSRSSKGVVRVTANSVAAIDPRSDRVVGAAQVGSGPGPIAFGLGSLWVGNVDDQTVTRVDPGTLQPVKAIPVANTPTGIAVGGGSVWVATSTLDPFVVSTSRAASVSRIDPEFNTIASTDQLDVAAPGPVSVAAQRNGVWVAPWAGVLTRFDPTSGRTVQRLDPHSTPGAIATGDGALWIADDVGKNVIRLDPNGGMTSTAVGNGPSGVAVSPDGVWVTDSLDDTLERIDPDTLAVTNTIPVGHSPAGVAVGAGSVWVANSGDGTVSRIDPGTERVIATITLGGSPTAVTVADRRVWVTVDARLATPSVGGAGSGTLRIDTLSELGPLDPALVGTYVGLEVLQATCAKLVNFPDRPGSAAFVPTPEVAASLPAVSADGRTYTFTIRPGFRFSPPSNQPVTAQTFKDTIERTLNPKTKSIYVIDFTDIVGAGAYVAGKAHHISGVVARGRTLTIRLVAPNPDLLARLGEPPMCAVPSDTPIDAQGVNGIPMAGPYYIASYGPRQGVVLAPNPDYHGSRPRHFARIEVSVGISIARAIAAVTSGRADNVTLGSDANLSPPQLAAETSRLAARYGPASAAAKAGTQQYFVNPRNELVYFAFNTHRPLFADARMRQAVSYAIDRRALAALEPPYPLHPTDHYLPADMPGYSDLHAYPLTAHPATARTLADGRGRTAVLYTCEYSFCDEQARIVKTDLAAIGLRVQIKEFSFADLINRMAKRGEPFDLGYFDWVADFPDPDAMLNQLLETSALYPTFDVPTWRHRLAAAGSLSGPERYLTYGKLDIDLARDAAPLLAFGNTYTHDLFSARIGCQAYGAFGWIDLAALCLRHAPS
jgi:YVTN family beta-propeller protein